VFQPTVVTAVGYYPIVPWAPQAVALNQHFYAVAMMKAAQTTQILQMKKLE
jgi:hypothetical protein